MTRNPAEAKDLIHNLSQSSSTKSIDAERVNAIGVGTEAINAMQAQLANVVNLLKGKNVACVEEAEEDVNWIGGDQWNNQKYQNQWNQNGYQQNNQFQKQGQGSGQNSGFNKTQQQGGQSKSNLEAKMDLLLDGQAKLIGDFNTKLDKQYVTLKTEIDQVKVHMKHLDTQVAQVTAAIGRPGTNTRECNAISFESVEEEGEERDGFGLSENTSTDANIDVDRRGTPDFEISTILTKSKNLASPEITSTDARSDVDRRKGSNLKTSSEITSTDARADVDRRTPRSKGAESTETASAKQSEPKVSKPPLPYPKAPKTKKEAEEARCQQIMKELSLRIPFFEACKLAPALRKYVKKIVNKSMSLEEGVMMITDTCSQVILAKMPKKLEDPGAFVLGCTIGQLTFRRSLCDLGSSVNLMPLSVAKRLGFTEFFPTSITLILADRSTRKPEGILVDVPVKIGECWFPADFIVLDYETYDPKDPIILGRPFLATAGALIDVREGTIKLRTDDTTLEFVMDKTLKRPTIDGQTFSVAVDEVSEKEIECMVDKICDHGVFEQKKVEAELTKPYAGPVTAVKQKAPHRRHHPPKQRYKNSKPSLPSAGRRTNPPRCTRPEAVVPSYLGRPHAQNAYTPPWMRRLSKGPRPP